MFERTKVLKRGGAVFLTLSALRERPMCGYEVMKWISDRFFGLYKPSPGLIYPILRRLEGESYVSSEARGGKRLYSITEKGMRRLEEVKELMKDLVGEKLSFCKEKAELMRSLTKFRRRMLLVLLEADPERVLKVKEIVDGARERIEEVIEE